jgi:ElaB/YqjD/DUF883 family membrane-anchored ribosome-binding protein
MRSEKQIEKDMYRARENLEENLDKLVHKTRETISVQSRLEHWIAERPVLILGAVAAGAVFGLILPRRYS